MEAHLLQHEPWLRLGAFGLIFFAMAAWEVLAPRRVPAYPRRLRWPSNLGIVALDSVLLRLVLPVAATLLFLVSLQLPPTLMSFSCPLDD